MLYLHKPSLGMVAGVIGSLFLGYCVYFDRKRHRDPNFMKKLRQRRKRIRQTQKTHTLPSLKDPAAVQRYFYNQLQLGEEMLTSGKLDEGIECFGRAIAFCGQPNKLIDVLQQSMPSPVFHLMLQRLPAIMKNCSVAAGIIPDEME